MNDLRLIPRDQETSFGMKNRGPAYNFSDGEIVFVKDVYYDILDGHPNQQTVAAFKTIYPDLNERDFQWTVVTTMTDTDDVIKCIIQPFRDPHVGQGLGVVPPLHTQANYQLKIRQEYLTNPDDQTSVAMPP